LLVGDSLSRQKNIRVIKRHLVIHVESFKSRPAKLPSMICNRVNNGNVPWRREWQQVRLQPPPVCRPPPRDHKNSIVIKGLFPGRVSRPHPVEVEWLLRSLSCSINLCSAEYTVAAWSPNKNSKTDCLVLLVPDWYKTLLFQAKCRVADKARWSHVTIDSLREPRALRSAFLKRQERRRNRPGVREDGEIREQDDVRRVGPARLDPRPQDHAGAGANGVRDQSVDQSADSWSVQIVGDSDFAASQLPERARGESSVASRPQATDSEVSYVGYQGWNREVVEHLTLDGMMGTLELASHPLEPEPGPSRPPAPRQPSSRTYLEGPEARLE